LHTSLPESGPAIPTVEPVSKSMTKDDQARRGMLWARRGYFELTDDTALVLQGAAPAPLVLAYQARPKIHESDGQ